MANILLTISYDGTDFCGWQRQDKSDKGKPVRTVQGLIEDALEKMLGQKIKIYGSGRTDSGVHARGQVANFNCPFTSIPVQNFPRALNGLLPGDIRLLKAEKVPEDFNSRFSATSRTYRYFILPAEIPFASESRYVWAIPNKPNVSILNEMAAVLQGELDCATFAASGDMSLSTYRYIDKAHFFMQDNKLVFEIEANAFLWKMVRSVTGTLIQMEQKGFSAKDFEKVVKSCNRKCAGTTAPAKGLFLWSVQFDGIRRHV